VRAADRVAHAFASLAIEERPEAWIAVRPARPAGEADGSFFGVTVLAPASGDQIAVERRLVGDGGDDEGNLRPRGAAGRWSDSRAVPA